MMEISQALSDREALLRWAAGRDEEALALLIQRHGGRVYGVALRAPGGSPALAEDVAQAVLAVMARKASALAGHPSLAAAS